MSSTYFESIFSGFESFVLEISKISGKCNSFTSLAIFSNIWKHNYFSKSMIFFKRLKDLYGQYGDLISSKLMVRNYDIVRFLQTLGFFKYWTADSKNISSAVISNMFF